MPRPNRGMFVLFALPVLVVAVMLAWYLLGRQPAEARDVDPAVLTRMRVAAGTMIVGAIAAWLALRGRGS